LTASDDMPINYQNQVRLRGPKIMLEKTINKILPWGTRRRHIYQLGFSTVRIIREEGWQAFWARAFPKILRLVYRRSDKLFEHWMAKYEPTPEALKDQKRAAAQLAYQPLISIITPVWNTDPRWLSAAIESVLQQTYPNWELCLVDGGSSKTAILKILKDYAARDNRIKVQLLPQNLGISGNSNAALAMAGGEYIALLDHDDELAPFALFEVAKALNTLPDLDFIYSDEDKLSVKGKRQDPFFKPDWSPDLFLSIMYTCHLGVYRKKRVDEIGGFRPQYDGSQDYDLTLRITDKTRKIYHIPRILYHWRVLKESAANNIEVKPYAYVAGRNALTDYLKRNSIQGEILDGLLPGSYRLRRQIINQPMVSIIIPSKDKPSVLKACIESILAKTDYPNYEIMIVDNQSRDQKLFEYYHDIQKNPRVTILHYDQPFNFSALNNFAVKQARGQHLLFLNNDTEVISAEWLSAMLEHSQRPEVGAVGARLLYFNNSIQHCGVVLGLGGVSGHLYSRQFEVKNPHTRYAVIGDYSAVTGACLMTKKTLFDQMGGFDAGLTVGFNDIDYCLRLRKQNLLVVYTPYAQLYHYESLTRGYDEESAAKRRRCQDEADVMQARWGAMVDLGDPYYNPNLSLNSKDYSPKY
jgi:O-antigen biosynthesis protein